MNSTQKHKILSHDADLDGVASAILLTIFIKREYQCIPEVIFANYENVGDLIKKASVDSTHLWISDLSIRDLDLAQTLSKYTPETLHFFDHHTDSQLFIDAIKEFATISFDFSGTKCAADLIFDFMLPMLIKIPDEYGNLDLWINDLKFIRDVTHSRDLWVNDIPEGEYLTQVISILGPEKAYQELFRDIRRFYRGEFTDLMNICCNIDKDLVEKAKKTARASMVKHFYRPDSPKSCAAGITLIAAFTTGRQSEVGDMFLQEVPRAIVGFINLEKLTLSFRTTQDVIQQIGFGVNEIAKTIEGGGGHAYAAGAFLTDEMLLGGPKALLALMTQVVDEKCFEKEGIKTR